MAICLLTVALVLSVAVTSRCVELVADVRTCPVPFSTSSTDGLPTECDWSVFSALYELTGNDSVLSQQRTALLKYTDDQFAAAEEDIRANLLALNVQGFDTVWPGNGFNGVAYGGFDAVLLRLEEAGIAKRGKRMGASGGACSAIFTLSNSGDLFIRLYQVYELYYRGRPDRLAKEVVRNTALTAAIYAELARDGIVFARALTDIVVVSSCSETSNTLFHSFSKREQLVAAGYSSGDASLGGAVRGTHVEGASISGRCFDGGTMAAFPASIASPGFDVVLYQTPFISTIQPTTDSIDALFKAGVDNTIAMLRSPSLNVSDSGGSLLTVRPGLDGIVTEAEFAPIAARVGAPSTTDVNLSSSSLEKHGVEVVSI